MFGGKYRINKTKNLLIYVALILLAIFIVNMNTKFIENDETILAAITESFNKNLNEDDNESFKLTKIEKCLQSVLNSNTDIKRAVIYQKREGMYQKLLYYGNNESFLSERYLKNKIVNQPFDKSKSKGLLIISPIMDSTYKVLRVFSLDFSQSSLKEVIDKTVLTAFVAAVLILLVVILFIAVNQNKRLKKEIELNKQISDKLKEREILFKTIFDQAPIGIAIGKNSKYVNIDNKPGVNHAFEIITGRKKEELINISWADITHPDDLAKDLEYFEEFKSGNINGYDMDKRYIKPDGSEVWIHMRIVPINLYNTNNEYHLCIIEDITERKNIEKALMESERSKAVLLDNLPGMAYRCLFDKDWTMQFISAGCFKLTGYKPEDLLYNKVLSYNDIIVPEYRDILWRAWQRNLQFKIPFRYEYEIITASGEKKWVMEIGRGVYNEKGEVEALEGIVIDITNTKEKEAQIKHISNHDFLTGLFNRIFYEEEMLRLDNEAFLPLSIIIVDINGLRLINNAYGYNTGNTMIRETAQILQSCVQKGDILARIGGNEFGILMPKTDNKTANSMLKKIIKATSNFNINNENKLYEISLSIGLATRETIEQSITDVAKTADEYLKNSKLLNNKSSHSDIISSMMATVFEKSQETEEHAKRLAVLSKKIGEKMGLSETSLGELELVAMLHDIGKVAIDSRILNKPGKLDESEWEIMKTHSEIGYRIAKSSAGLETIAEYILYHHERWDGKGYPKGLKGKGIPLISRIISVVDAYDAMTQNRAYSKAKPAELAIEELIKNSGTQFDPEIVSIFIDSIKQK